MGRAGTLDCELVVAVELVRVVTARSVTMFSVLRVTVQGGASVVDGVRLVLLCNVRADRVDVDTLAEACAHMAVGGELSVPFLDDLSA